MRAKYKALDRRVAEIEKVVDRCLEENGSHLPASTVASIRATVMRTAEGVLCAMTEDALIGRDPQSVAFRLLVAKEIEADTMKGINAAAGPAFGWLN